MAALPITQKPKHDTTGNERVEQLMKPFTKHTTVKWYGCKCLMGLPPPL